ncbi:MAG: sigma-70 family RNA polymerase sigma factor [Candidatus Omnitrophica bacterium]|nr:sigma-70 family RNA polymerase sigma factor [Candidatus Omnitrophota bacterium]
MSEALKQPGEWVDLYADDLFSYALKFIPNRETAQNLVQETFLAALKSRESFAGKSTPKTWFIGILKNKIADHLRAKYREVPVSQLIDDDQHIDGFFDSQNGHLAQEPKAWTFNPEVLTENKEFWRTYEDCLKHLPSRTAQAFNLKEMENLDTQEICKVLAMTPTNLWVALHRARLSLRECLEKKWFNA